MKRFLIYGLLSLALQWSARGQFLDPKEDSLCFNLKQICSDSVKGTICRLNIDPERKYDFEGQYPFYQFDGKKWKVGEQFQLEFTELPGAGTLYIFSLDASNTPKIFPPVIITKDLQLPVLYPAPQKGLTFDLEGVEFIGIWYSSDSITNADRLIRGLELTIGSIMKRTNRQLGKRLLLPSHGWHFYEKKFGFMIQSELVEETGRFVLPVMMEMEVVKSSGAKKTRKIKKD